MSQSEVRVAASGFDPITTPENRTAFLQTIADFAEQYDLHGINFECL